MPELPEVETSRRGIEPFLVKQQVKDIIIRQAKLRWPIPDTLSQLQGQIIESIERRGKYLLLNTNRGCVILHLGMSGSLRILPQDAPLQKHDHVVLIFKNKLCLRFNDPRRFGAVLWTNENPYEHPLLAKLGPEPLSADFSTDYLFQRSRHIKRAIKLFIMDSNIVVGVGNIYANEALFLAGIDPRKAAGSISKKRYEKLLTTIKTVLTKAIAAGGTTLKDFQQSDGKPGYFKQELRVYGREGKSCHHCHRILKTLRINQRATVYCSHCQR